MSNASERRAGRTWWIGFVSGMASYIDAAAIVSFGTALVLFQGALGLTPTEVGLISAALTFGIAVGALVGGRLGDRFGRRPVFSVTMVLIALGAAGAIFGEGATILFIAALVLGLATGADLPVSLSTISEAADDSNRGKLLGFSNLLWLVGSVVAVLGGAAVASLGRLGGQILFAHIAIVAILVLIGRLTIPESATWLAAREERSRGIDTARAARAKVGLLLQAPYRKPFLALVIFYSLTNLVANTGGQFGTYLLVNVANVDVQVATLIGLPFIPLGVIGAIWFMRVADSPKRFKYFTVGAVIWTVAQLVPAVFGVSLITFVIAGVLGIVGTSFAFEGMMKVWTQEQFPTLLRTTAQGAIIAVARFFAAALASVTPLIVAISPTVFYAFLATVMAAGSATAWVVFRKLDRHNEFTTESLATLGEVDATATGQPTREATA